MSAYTPRSVRAMTVLLGMDETGYRDLLRDNYGVASSKELKPAQLQELGRTLQLQLNGKSTPRKRYADMGSRMQDMASPAQLRAIEAMWMGVSTQPTTEAKRAALDAMCLRITGIRTVRWLTKAAAKNLIKAIQSMGAQSPEQYNRTNNQQEATHG